jgi:5-formyltetrahydrofolate cyclo-ligase
MTFDKDQLRKEARAWRKSLAEKAPDFAVALARHAGALPLKVGAIVGAYHALPDEADPALLLGRLVELGMHIAFPRVAGRGQPLEFHRIPDGEVLRTGAYGIQEPAAHFPVVRPNLLLVPLLAFDRNGHRLGYGGGFYDRTIALLKVPAFGIAYAGQEISFREISSLPVEAHDIALSGILTENGLKRFS